MSLDNGKVMIPWPLAQLILGLDLNAPTLRLVISMLHQLDLRGVCGASGPETCPMIWASCVDLRERVGPRGSNGAREMHAAAAALLAAGLVDEITLLKNAAVLRWRFSPWIWQAMRIRDTSNYVLVDLDELGRFRSVFRIGIYLNSQKRRGSKAPEFRVNYDTTISEEANMRRLLSGLESVQQVLGWVFFIALELRPSEPEPAQFRIKIVHEASRWSHHSYMKFELPKAVWRISNSGCERYDPREVRRLRADPLKCGELRLDQQLPRAP